MDSSIIKHIKNAQGQETQRSGGIKHLIEESKATGERLNRVISVEAMDQAQELIATFKMEISVKVV